MHCDVPPSPPCLFTYTTPLQIAILVYGDMLTALGDRMLAHLDGPAGMEKPSQSALCQLLLKSVSKDKKFVLEAAQQVLRTASETLDARDMALKLLAYAKHKCATHLLLPDI